MVLDADTLYPAMCFMMPFLARRDDRASIQVIMGLRAAAIALAVTLGLLAGCRRESSSENCSAEMRGLLDNRDIPPEAGISLSAISNGGSAQTHDKNRNITGGVYVVADVCESKGEKRTEGFHVVYLPTGTELDTHDSRQIADQTVLDMDVPDFKDLTPVVQSPQSIPAGSYTLTRENSYSGIFLEIRCRASACDLNRLHVRHRQFGPSTMFLWLTRDNWTESLL
jgi:hypothetical protein